MAIEFVTFDKAVEELGISPDQLKKAISSGEVRAFSDGGTFKFRRQDLDAFKNKRQTSQTLNIPPTAQVKAPPKPPAPAPAAPPSAAPSADEIPELTLEDIEPVLEEAQAAAPAEVPEALPELPELPTEETVVSPAPPSGVQEEIPMPTQVTEELTLDDIPDLGATQPGTQEVSLEEIPQPEVLPLEGDLDLLTEGGGADATQPIEIQGEEAASSPAYGTVSMEVPEGITEAPEEFGMSPAATGGLDVKREGSPLWAAVAAVTTLFLVLAWVVVLGTSKDYPVGYLGLFSDFMYSGPS